MEHGRFSYFVFKGLEGEADSNQDGKISAGELHTFVRESVGRFSAGAQTPTMLGDAGRWVCDENEKVLLWIICCHFSLAAVFQARLLAMHQLLLSPLLESYSSETNGKSVMQSTASHVGPVSATTLDGFCIVIGMIARMEELLEDALSRVELVLR